jgi:uncharacterized protein
VQSSLSGGSLSRAPHERRREGRIRFRVRQAIGKARRFFRANIYTAKNEELLARRQGECTRCGACCKILIRCPFLIEKPDNAPGDIYSCSIYGSRFSQCRIYPIVPRDLLEVEEECGYTFAEPNTPLH